MFLSTKEIIFFVLIFVITFLASNTSSIVNKQYQPSKITHTVYLLGLSLAVAVILMLVYKFAKIPNCSQKDNFHFQVTPPKMCEGGPYMYSSAPQELQDYCNDLLATPEGRRELASVSCPNGYVGSPKYYQYTPESNDMWENTRCWAPKVGDRCCRV